METNANVPEPSPTLCETTNMGTYRQIYYQIVFGTKYRKPTINPQYDDDLYRYIWGIIENKKCKLYRINGIEDHIQIMSDLHPTICLADFVKDKKVASSIWMKENGRFLHLKVGRMDMVLSPIQ